MLEALGRLVLMSLLVTAVFAATTEEAPSWAYPVNPANMAQTPDDGALKRVPNSSAVFTRAQIAAINVAVPDWHPEEHPSMPDIVRKGRAPQVYACGYCHLPTGAGRPENTSLAGLSANYIRQQMLAFARGERPGSQAARLPQTAMIALAKQATEAEVTEAADYFSALKPQTFVRVIETDFVPKTRIAGWTLTFTTGGSVEPLGSRIIEVPEDFERFENRDSHTSYIAYVPKGSLARGAVLISTGCGDISHRCAACHGPEYKGLGDVPRLAGRSPSYLFRQLYDFRNGTRSGANSELMKPIVAPLTEQDMIALVAYLASREP